MTVRNSEFSLHMWYVINIFSFIIVAVVLGHHQVKFLVDWIDPKTCIDMLELIAKSIEFIGYIFGSIFVLLYFLKFFLNVSITAMWPCWATDL